MYFQKKREVVVLLVLLLISMAGILFFDSFKGGITGAAVVVPLDSSDIGECTDLINGDYTLTNNVSASGTCFHVLNNSILLDCQGYAINYSYSIDGEGINNTGGFDNVTIRNCIIQESQFGSNTYTSAIHFAGVVNSTIENTAISTIGSSGHGIILEYSNKNVIRNVNISTSLALGSNAVGILLNGSDPLSGDKSNGNLLENIKVNKSLSPLVHEGGALNQLVYNNSLGFINWTKGNLTTNVNLSHLPPGNPIFLENNLVGFANLPSTVPADMAYNLNSTAQIQIKNLSDYENIPYLLKDGVRCDDSVYCNITFDSASGILYANISSFSNYSTQETDPPDVILIHPTNGSNFSAELIDFNLSITDFTGVSNVTFVFSNVSQSFNISSSSASSWNATGVSMSIFAEGLQGVRIFANDSYNNINYTEFINFTVDLSAPLVTINVPPADSILSGSQSFQATVTDSYTRVESVLWQVSNGTNPFNITGINLIDDVWGDSGGGVNTRIIIDGLNTITIYANDTVSNVNATSYSVTIDNTPPNVTKNHLNSPVDNGNFSISSGNQTFNVSVFDALIDVDSVYFYFDNGTYAMGSNRGFNLTAVNQSGNWVASFNVSILYEGRQGARIFANDTLGNENSTFTFNFTVDYTPPNVTRNFLNNPADNSAFDLRSNNQTFNASIFDALTDINSVYFWFDNGTGNDFNATAVNRSGDWIVSYNVSSLSLGAQGLRIVANDSSGNENSTFVINFTLDLTPPNVTINYLNNPVDNSNFSIRTGRKIFNASVFDALSDVDNVYFWFDNGTGKDFNVSGFNRSGEWTSDPGGSGGYNVSTLAEGKQGVRIVANDTAGNENSSYFVNFTMDYTPPNITVNNLNSPVDNGNFSISSGNQTFNVSVFDAVTGVGIVDSVYFWFDNGTNAVGSSNDFNVTATNQSGEWVVSYNVSSLAEGRQGVRIMANDTVGNENSTSIINFTVDFSPPSVTFTNPADRSSNLIGMIDVNVTITDLTAVDTVIFQFLNNTNPFNRTASNTSGTWNVTINSSILVNGIAVYVEVYANDTFNYLNDTVSISFTSGDGIVVAPVGGDTGGSGGAAGSTPPQTAGERAAWAAAAGIAGSGVAGDSSGVASGSEALGAFQSGQAQASVSSSSGSSGPASVASTQSYVVTLTNNFDKQLVVSGSLDGRGLETSLENEDNALKRIKEQLLLEGEADEEKAKNELILLKLFENLEVFQLYKTRLSHLLPSPVTGAAVSMTLTPTGKRIEGNLLKDTLVNADELKDIRLDPGQSLEKEIKIRKGLRLGNRDPPKIIFSSGGEQVFIKELESQEKTVTGTAIDMNYEKKKLDFYVIITPQAGAGKEMFSVELDINTIGPENKKKSFKIPLKTNPFFLFNGGTESVFSELYGPYTVNLEKGALLAVQYDASSLEGDLEVVGKIYKKGAELVSENKFQISAGGEAEKYR